jgi:S1-C subfamily serine protease
MFTNVHGDYHKPSDDWDKIDAAGLETVGEFTARIVASVAGRPDRLTLIPGVGAPAQETGGYGAYLGTVPDFTPVDHGVLLSGVSAGSPAEEAGIEGGDIIIGLGEHEIADLYGLTDALRAHAPGDKVRVVIMRDGEQLELEVELGDRADRDS